MPLVPSDLASMLADRLSKFTFDVVDEVAQPNDTSYQRYNSMNPNWIGTNQVVTVINLDGSQTILSSTQYTVTVGAGYVTLTTPLVANNQVWLAYSFNPFTSTNLTSMINYAISGLQTLIYRPISITNIPPNYVEAILKKSFTIAMREMQFPTIKYFAISVGGRTLNKEEQTTMINDLIESNEKELLMDINSIRYHDTTSVMQ